MKTPRIHQYPAEFYESTAEFRACRYIAAAHALVAWALMLGLGLVLAAAALVLLG